MGAPRVEFFSKVDLRRGLGACWLWTGRLNGGGYGSFRERTAHRWLWTRLFGELPRALDLDHLCRVRHCVNPFHLEPVTRGENLRRGLNGAVAKANGSLNKAIAAAHTYWRNRTHCNHGHPLDASYDSARDGTVRYCKTCAKAKRKRQYARYKEARIAARRAA